MATGLVAASWPMTSALPCCGWSSMAITSPLIQPSRLAYSMRSSLVVAGVVSFWRVR